MFRPIHPGEILREDYVVPLGMSKRVGEGAVHLQAAQKDRRTELRRVTQP